jgi:hypothetical protein
MTCAADYGIVHRMALTEAAFTALVDAGCSACGSKVLLLEAMVSQKLPLCGGELYGTASWAYKGEELVAGTYSIACSACKNELMRETACVRCSSEGGIARALESETSLVFPVSCSACQSELMTAVALVPATVLYEGKRANKAKPQAFPEEPGFHALRVSCNRCHEATVPPASAGCALCGPRAQSDFR